MTWIAKSYAHATHLVVGYRERVEVRGVGWQWRAVTACGRTITGISGESVAEPDCRVCLRAARQPS